MGRLRIGETKKIARKKEEKAQDKIIISTSAMQVGHN